MKKLFSIFLFYGILLSCSENFVLTQDSPEQVVQYCNVNQERLSFSSREAFLSVFKTMEQRKSSGQLTRALEENGVQYEQSIENGGFVSLYEFKKQELFSKFTKSQLDSIENDPDSLEFCLEDSIIFDQLFAELLNKDREIEVSDTVYKYFENGIARVKTSDYESLFAAENQIMSIDPTQDNSGLDIQIDAVTFTPVERMKVLEVEGTNLSNYNYGGSPTNKPNVSISNSSVASYGDNLNLRCLDVCIDGKDVRYKDYKTQSGDGSVLHKLCNKIAGYSYTCDNKWNDHNKLQLNIIEQYFLFHTTVGVDAKKKKKVLGIWWKVKADDIVLGWNPLEIGIKLPKLHDLQVPDNHNFNDSKTPELSLPDALKVFPFQDKKQEFLVLRLPDEDYTLVDGGALNKFFKDRVSSALNKCANDVKKAINGDMQHVGLYTIKEESLYYMICPDEIHKSNSHGIEKDYYNSNFAGEYIIGYSWGRSDHPIFDVKADKSTAMNRGIVYCASNHKGKWKACVITKE